jgi:hypothetical protein
MSKMLDPTFPPFTEEQLSRCFAPAGTHKVNADPRPAGGLLYTVGAPPLTADHEVAVRYTTPNERDPRRQSAGEQAEATTDQANRMAQATQDVLEELQEMEEGAEQA